MRAPPRGKRVRREAAVHEGHVRLEVLLEEVGVVAREAGACEHALVVDDPRGQRAQIHRCVGELVRGVHHLLPEHVQSRLKATHVLLKRAVGGHGALLDDRFDAPRGLPKAIRVHGHGPPTEELQTRHRCASGLQELLPIQEPLLRPWQEDIADGVGAGRRELHANLLELSPHEAVGGPAEDARAVARVHLAAAGSTMVKVLQDQQCVLDGRPRGSALKVRNHADAAAVLLATGVVQSLLLGHPIEGGILGDRHDSDALGD
mmetsp:Transcript_66238/g.191921  ORF Transcript_66238/g.191921 Transcript_66238/m.191921 type:complete len:261 (+) Transcript_66238:561-1343(+)